jgi:DNA polymerase-4
MDNRVILHCDLNNYFASVESIGHPEVRNVPMAVCGSSEERHGIVLAKNEPAKALGIKTAMTVVEAKRLCPNLLMVPPHYDKYMEFSHKVQEIYARYTDRIEPFGIDECWLDVTGSRRLFGSGQEIADRLRKEVKETYDLTISVGVSFCKVMAKLGSDMKKPDATTLITPEDLPQKVWGLSVKELFGVGRHTGQKLQDLGIYTIGQLANTDPTILKSRLGKNGVQLWQFANGLEQSPVRKYGESDPPKSFSRSTTCKADLLTGKQVQQVLVGLAEQVSADLRKHGYYAGTIHLIFRDNTLCFTTRQMRLERPTRLTKTMVTTAMELLKEHWSGVPLRSVGIGAGNLVPQSTPLQTGLFFDLAALEKKERLEAKVDELRSTMGQNTITRASQLLTPQHVKLGSSFGHVNF